MKHGWDHMTSECATCGETLIPGDEVVWTDAELRPHHARCVPDVDESAAPSSAVPLESMIEEMTKAGRKIVIRYEFPHDMHVVRALDRPNGEPEIGAAKPTVEEAIHSVYAAWRERE